MCFMKYRAKQEFNKRDIIKIQGSRFRRNNHSIQRPLLLFLPLWNRGRTRRRSTRRRRSKVGRERYCRVEPCIHQVSTATRAAPCSIHQLSANFNQTLTHTLTKHSSHNRIFSTKIEPLVGIGTFNPTLLEKKTVQRNTNLTRTQETLLTEMHASLRNKRHQIALQ